MKPIIFLFAAFVTTTNVAAQSCYHEEVRLVGGLSPNEGRVEVCVNGVWGTVTDDGFYTSNAKVVCRQLGYPVDDPGASTTYRCCAQYGQGSGVIHLNYVGCRGTEASLLECSYRNPSSSDSHSEDVGVICPTCDPDHAIRLSNGLAPEEGTVEICFSGIWRSVCHSSWDHKDAFVVCRQLGYPATAARVFYNAYFGDHPRPNISRVLCYGNESKLLDCSYTNTTTCSPTNTAGVRCQGETISDPLCTESTIRLAGGQDEHEGRVELCSNGLWGTICSGLWDYNDTFVLCKQLGYQNPRVFVYRYSSFFGQGSGPILFDDLTCDRTELALTQCSSSSPDQVYCSHSGDAGARCEEISTTVIDTCSDGDIRLMDGRSAAEGRVEICINNIWGSVCDAGWNNYDAGVVCHQLGFQSANAIAYRSAYFGRSAGPYILDDVGCYGDEQTLLGCSHGGTFFHDCSSGRDAGVKCEVSSCVHGTVQLVGGVTSYGGRLQICNNGRWATVCYNNFGSVSASVICKQLLGESASAVWTRTEYFGQGSSTSILDDLSCTGSESSISQCTYTEVRDFRAAGCYHNRDVVMVCYEVAGCTNLDVRLVDGDTGREGRVEICVDGVWGAVRSHTITNLAARVICNQLGHPSEWSIPLSTTVFGRGKVPVLVYRISCSEGAATLQDCNVLSYSTSSSGGNIAAIYNSAVGGLICQGNVTSETECAPGDARLAGGLKANEGRVEVCIDGFWGTVCEEGWDDKDAIVICKQLGLSPTANPALGFGEGRGPIISHVSCTSRESNIAQCEWRTGTTNCHHGRDVAIKCEDPHKYQVTLAVTSQQDEEGPFQIGTTVTLQCLVHPPLPVLKEITYTWTSSASRFRPQYTNSSFPNATLVIPAGHPQEGRYYCHVYRRQFLLGVGAGSIQVQNLLYALGSQSVQYTPAESVSLNINVASTPTDIHYNFRALTWFHDGVEVIRNERITITDFNKTLTISNATDDDSGVYEAVFTGLFIHPYNEYCERDILALLRYYPVAIPVHFYVYQNSPELIAQDTTDTAVEFGLDENEQQITSENISMTVRGKVHASIRGTVSTVWHFNGGTLRPGTTLGPLKQPFLHLFQNMEIENANSLDFGFYEVALTINTRTHLLSHHKCPSGYYSFVAYTLRLDHIVLARDMMEITQSDVRNPVLHKPVEDRGQEFFQIQVGPVEHCVTWNTEKATALENSIQNAVISVIENYCECTFPASNIDPGQFICSMTTEDVTYRSTISGTIGNNASQLLAILQDWVASGPVIKLNWKLLRVSPGCPTRIASMADPECSLSGPTHTMFDDPTLITSDSKVIKCVNACLYRKQGHGICGAY